MIGVSYTKNAISPLGNQTIRRSPHFRGADAPPFFPASQRFGRHIIYQAYFLNVYIIFSYDSPTNYCRLEPKVFHLAKIFIFAFPSLPFLSFPSIPFHSIPFHSLPFPSLPFPSLVQIWSKRKRFLPTFANDSQDLRGRKYLITTLV